MNNMKKVTFEDRVRAGMNIVSGEEFHKNFVTIADMAAENLEKTLGPYAHTTLIDDGSSIYPTKDGWNIINRLRFGNGIQNSLYGMMKDISFHLASTVGDGTTTAIVASNAMIKEINKPEYKELLASSRQRDILDSMRVIKNEIQKRLESPDYLHTVSSDNDYEDIYKIAMISSNENEEVSSMIRQIYMQTNNPNIHVNMSNGRKISYEIQNGYRLDCSPKGINAYINYEGNVFMGRNVLCCFINHNVTYASHKELINVMIECASEANTTLLVFAPYFDDIIMNAFTGVINTATRNGQIPNVMAIQVGTGRSIQKSLFDDAAMITKSGMFNGHNLDEVMDMVHPHDAEGKPLEVTQTDLIRANNKLRDYIKTFFGFSPKVTVTKEYVLFEDYDRESTKFVNTLNEVKEAYYECQKKAAKDMSPLNQEFMDISTRYTKLSGAMGIINIGAESELEQRCVKDSVDDAVLACRSAFTNGYVVGMNLATIGATKDIITAMENAHRTDSIDYQMAKIIHNTFRHVTYRMMHNKYPDSVQDDAVWKTTAPIDDNGNTMQIFGIDRCDAKASADQIIDLCIKNKFGYDVVSEAFTYGTHKVINSVKTDVEILGAMMSIVTYAFTSNQMLSLNQSFDEVIGNRMLHENDVEKYSAMGEGLAKGFRTYYDSEKQVDAWPDIKEDGSSSPKIKVNTYPDIDEDGPFFPEKDFSPWWNNPFTNPTGK